MVAVLLLGAALRVGMLAQDVRLDSDEALYASLARRMALKGDLLLSDVLLDKPPLGLLAIAGSFSAFGVSEFAARLPGLFSSIITGAACYALARRLYGTRTAIVSLALLALSPMDLAFAATAYLDAPMTLMLLLACLAASRDRWGAAGAAFMAAIAVKQNALFFWPLVLLIGLARNAEPNWAWRDLARRLIRFGLAALIGAITLALWSAARAAPLDFWTLGSLNNNPGRLIRAAEVLPRLQRWLALLSNVTGFAPLLLLTLIPLLVARRERRSLIDLVLFAYVLALLLAYWLIAFNTYDRYLHPVGPLVLLLVARGAVMLSG